MIKVLKFLELAWLAIGVFSLLMGAYIFNTQGFDQAKWFLAGTALAAAFYTWRKRVRKQLEAQEAHDKDNA